MFSAHFKPVRAFEATIFWLGLQAVTTQPSNFSGAILAHCSALHTHNKLYFPNTRPCQEIATASPKSFDFVQKQRSILKRSETTFRPLLLQKDGQVSINTDSGKKASIQKTTKPQAAICEWWWVHERAKELRLCYSLIRINCSGTKEATQWQENLPHSNSNNNHLNYVNCVEYLLLSPWKSTHYV